MVQEELEFQKEQGIKEIEGANGVIQELNEVVREKEETMEYKEEIINEQSVRIDELTQQLSECVEKWETEKAAYVPTSDKMADIDQELVRMNHFMVELDGRNRQLLEINKRRMQQTAPPEGK